MKRRIAYCVMIGLLLLGAITVGAAGQESPPALEEAWKTWEVTENPRDLIEAYRVWKLTDALDLSEEQMPVFFAKLREMDKQDAELRQEELKALRHIAELVDRQNVEEAELRKALRSYEDLRKRHLEEVGRIRQEAAELLTLRQRCQYVVFEERFKTHLRNMIGRVREIRRQQGLDRRGEFGRPDDFGERGSLGPGGSQRGGSGSGGSGRGRR